MNTWMSCPGLAEIPTKWIRRSVVIERALCYWTGPRRTAIQAGAHMGVWPCRLASEFDAVYCFEPEPRNWDCLMRHMQTIPHPAITCSPKALGEDEGTLCLHTHKYTGPHHITMRQDVPHISVPCTSIDALDLQDVDAIFLDIEGYEWFALQGAQRTIARTRPLLVLEENGCSRKYGIERGTLQHHLARWGYRQTGTYDEDIIMVPTERGLVRERMP